MNDEQKKAALNEIYQYVSRNERIAWTRRHASFIKRIERDVTPIEDKILELTMQKMQIMDDMEEDRQELIRSCIHPKEFLFFKDDHVICRFCQARLKVKID